MTVQTSNNKVCFVLSVGQNVSAVLDRLYFLQLSVWTLWCLCQVNCVAKHYVCWWQLDLKSIYHPTHLSWHFLLAVWAAFTCVLSRYASESLSVLFHSALWPAEREWRGVWSLAGLEISVTETNLKMWDSADRDPAMVKTLSLKSWGQMNTSSSSRDEVSF